MCIYIYTPVVPHKAVAEVSKMENLQERRVAVAQKWQSEPTDGLKGGCVFLPFCLFLSLSLCLSLSPSIYRATFLAIYLSTCLFMYLSIDLFIHLSIKLSIFLSIQPFIHPLTSLCQFFFRPSLHRSMSTAIHHHVLRSVSLSIHPCICPSTSSSSHPSIYLATHAFIWSSTLLAIFRSSDLCVHLAIHLPVY